MFSRSTSLSRLVLQRGALVIVASAMLGGCAMAPGFSMGNGLKGESAPTAGTQADAAPPGALRSITPELIQQQRALQKTELGSDVKRLFGEARPYTVGPADVVNIVVWNHPELVLAPAGATLTTDSAGLAVVGNGYNVSSEGLIQFPLIGTFKIAGLTETQARDQLTRRLSKYLRDPQVTLRVQAYRAGRVYVGGEVRTPGLQAINDIPMTLPEALSRAGGLTPVADRAIVAITRNGATTEVNLPQLTAMGVNPSRILLAAGDLVRVGNRDDAKVYVMGEVTRPSALPLRNGSLTLNEALGEAGGVNAMSGDPRQIYVVRSHSGNQGTGATPVRPEIYHLDAQSPTAYALAEGFALQPHDVVYVDPVPLALWNRVISLVLPSAQAVNVTRDATK